MFEYNTQPPAIGYRLSAIGYLPSLRPNQPPYQTLLASLGALYVRGVPIAWAGLHREVTRHKVALPTYPFQRQRYWVEAPAAQNPAALRPLVDRMFRVARRQETIFEKTVSTAALPFLADHQIYGTVVIPGAYHLAMALSGAGLLFDDAPCVVEDVIFPQVLTLGTDEARTVQLTVTAGRDGHAASFEVISLNETAASEEVLHATGRLARGGARVAPMLLDALRVRCPRAVAPDELYARIAAMEVVLGPQFQWFSGVWTSGAGEVLAQLRRPASLPEMRGYALFPSLIDACFQLLAAADEMETTRLPFALERLSWYQPGDHAELWCYVERAAAEGEPRWNFTLGAPDGTVVARLEGLQLRAVPANAIQGTRLRTDWLSVLTWQPQALPPTPEPAPAAWLLVGATDALAATLADHAPVTRLSATTDAATLRQQVDALAAQHPSLGVVFLGEGQSLTQDNAPTAALSACTTLLHLSQALSAAASVVRLWVVTAGAQTVAEYGQANGAALAVGGSLWGFGRSLAREEPRLRTVLVDLDASQPIEIQAHTLIEELQAGAGGEVAWRGETRFAAQLTPWRNSEGASVPPAVPLCSPEASYLITGGLGALGLQVAEQLVADGARHLVLSSRRAAQTVEQRETLARLVAAGATVEIVSADVGDAVAVEALLARCAALGPLRGIVHAAGVLDDGVIAAQTSARFAGVMRPKAEGAWHLHQQSAGLELDFFVAFSSLASFMGSAGQSTYAAANGFVDGLMQLRRAQGLPALSINWGPWAEVGMAAGLAEQFRRQGMGMIAPAQGRALFRHAVSHAEGQVAVLPPIHQASAPLAQTPTMRADLGRLPDADQQPWLIHWLRQEVARILLLDGPELVELQRPLFELGMDSLMAIELRNRLSTNLDLPLHATLIFEYPTIERLAPWLLDQFRLSLDGTTAAVSASPQPQALARLKLDAVEEDITDATDAELLAFIDQEFGEVS